MSRGAALEPVRWDEAAYRARIREAQERGQREAGRSLAEDLAGALADLSQPEADEILMSLPPHVWARLLWAWSFWSREKQREPPGDWLIWLVLTGRGFGKTRAAAEWIRDRVYSGAARVIGLIGPTHGDIRKFMLGGHLSKEWRLDAKKQNASGLLDVFPPHHRPTFDVTKGEVHFHTGAVAFVTTAEEPEIRGANFDTIWGDELCKWRYLEQLWYNLEMTCRVPPAPKMLLTTTPKNLPRLKAIIADPDTHVTVGHTRENAAHLAAKVLAKWERNYSGTRTGAQELGGEILDDNEGALWSSPTIETNRIYELPPLERITISVDPAVSTKRQSDDTGIVTQGLVAKTHRLAGHIGVLADRTGRYTPEEWGDIAIVEWERWSPVAPTIFVCERNRQGDGAAANLRAAMYRRSVKKGGDHGKATAASAAIRIEQVLAMGDKASRAEPVAQLAARGFVHHVGARENFRILEAEMTGWDPSVNPDSPNAVDAHVHGTVALVPELASAELPQEPPDMKGIADMNRRLTRPADERRNRKDLW